MRTSMIPTLEIGSFTLLLCLCLCQATPALASSNELISLSAIKTIESAGNPLAFNKYSGAIGLYQIVPSTCLADYNQYHKVKFTAKDLYDPTTNETVARWYLEVRIPQLLRHYKLPLTIENVLTSYNAGISYAIRAHHRGFVILPNETKNYIYKYRKLTGGVK